MVRIIGPRIPFPNKAGLSAEQGAAAFREKLKAQQKYELGRFSGRGIEEVVRPAVPRKAYALLDRLIKARRAPGEEAESSIRWGQASDFRVEELKPPELPKRRFINIGGGGPDDPELDTPEEFLVVYRETSRSTHVTRVFNPENEQQFVDVEVIDDITLQRSSDGALIQLQLNNPN